jgi:hypothetical protein
MLLIVEKHAAIQLEKNVRFRKTGDEKHFEGHAVRKVVTKEVHVTMFLVSHKLGVYDNKMFRIAFILVTEYRRKLHNQGV